MNYFDIQIAGKIIPHENHYEPEDVGKVVTENGEEYSLTAQTAKSITENGTYDTTLNNEVTVNVSGGGGGIDWSEIGYSAEPEEILEGFNYTKATMGNWSVQNYKLYTSDRKLMFAPMVDTSGLTIMDGMFFQCYGMVHVPLYDTSNVTSMVNVFYFNALRHIPLFNTSNVTNMQGAFYGSRSVETVPQFDTHNVVTFMQTFAFCDSLKNVPALSFASATSLTNMFQKCPNLTDESINNIMASCIGAVNYTGTKTLRTLGLEGTQLGRAGNLSNWSAFVAAGWTA